MPSCTPGRCGELVDCGHFERATRPVPAPYHPRGHINVGAVVPRMGNHLLDSSSPEIKDSLPFTRTFIYGAYEDELIFWEPMITLDFLKKTRNACFEISQPQEFRQSGYYPTQYCVRQHQQGGRKRDFNDYFVGVRNLDFTRELNPELQTFGEWLAVHAQEIPIPADQPA